LGGWLLVLGEFCYRAEKGPSRQKTGTGPFVFLALYAAQLRRGRDFSRTEFGIRYRTVVTRTYVEGY